MKKPSILITFFIVFHLLCGPPKPETMPEPINIYHEYTKEEIENMLKSTLWQERSTAVLYIQQKHWKDFSPTLLHLLKHDPSSAVRQIAAITLSDFEYQPALPIILELIKNPNVTNEAINVQYLIDAVSKFKDFRAIYEITDFLNDEDLVVRLHVVNALETANNFLNPNQKNQIGAKVLQHAQKNNDPEKHRTYAMALGRLQYKNSESYLLNLLNGNEPSNTKAAAILALGKIKSKNAIPLLIQYLKTYPDKLSENSYIALKEINDPVIIEKIFPLFDTEKKEIQLLVVDILAEIKSEQTKKIAYKKFKENNQNNIATLSLLLGKLKYKEATKEIETLLLNQQSPDREIIAQSLGWMQDRSAIPTLIYVLQEKEGEGRYGAAWSLGVLEAHESLPYLLQTARSSDKKLSILSIEALGHLKSKESLPILEQLAENPTTQLYAINAIGEIPGQEALNILKKFAKRKGEISHISIEVLSNRSEKEIIDILIEILKETSTEDIKAKILYKSLQRKTQKDYISKNQWIEWYHQIYKKQ